MKMNTSAASQNENDCSVRYERTLSGTWSTKMKISDRPRNRSRPEITPAPLMGITAVARARRVSVHRKNIAICMAHNCKAHGRPEPSVTFATHVVPCISVPCLAHIIGGHCVRFHFQLFYV